MRTITNSLKLSGILLAILLLFLASTAFAVEGDTKDLNLALGKIVTTTSEGEKIIAQGNPPFEIYTTYKYENVGLPISEIQLTASSNLTERGFDVGTPIQITYDDYCIETIKTTISKNGTWYKLQLGEGRMVRNIEILNGSSGNVTTVNKISIKEGKPAFTLKDSSPALGAPIGEPSIIDGNIVNLNWNLPRAFYPVGKLVSSITVTGNNWCSGSGTEDSNWSPAFDAQMKFYIDDNNYETVNLPFNRFVKTIQVPVPKAYANKVITKIEVVGGSQQRVRRIDIAAVELKVTSLQVTPKSVILNGPVPVQLKVTALFSNGTTKDVSADADISYDVDDPDAVTVSPKGLVSLANGAQNGDTAIIEIQYEEMDTSCSVKIQLDSVKSLKSSVSSIVLSNSPGKNTRQLKITALGTDGKQRTVTDQTIFSSSNPKQFTVTKTGIATVSPSAPKGSTGVITATYKGKSCTIKIKVK